MAFDLGSLLQQYLGGGAPARQAEAHFDQAAQSAPADVLGGGLLGQPTGGGATPRLSPAQASQLSPDQVQVIADHAERADPSIIDRMSAFYAEHPTLVKTVGAAALSIALAKMAERARG